MFEEMALRQPHAVAVESATGEHFTYQEVRAPALPHAVGCPVCAAEGCRTRGPHSANAYGVRVRTLLLVH